MQEGVRMRAAMNWLRVVVLTLLAAMPAGADVLRPLDERATARLVADEVARQAPGVEVKVHFVAGNAIVSVVRDGTAVALEADELHTALREAADGAAREALLQDFVRVGLAGAGQGGAEAAKVVPDLSRVMPVIRSPAGVLNRGQSNWAKAPWLGELLKCWVLDDPRAPINCIFTRDLLPAGLGKLEIDALGMANLEARMGEAVETEEGRFHLVSLGARFGSSLMLLPEYWQERAAQGQALVAAIPQEDMLIWIADPDPAELAALRALVELSGLGPTIVLGGLETWQADANPAETAAFEALVAMTTGPRGQPLSPQLYRWTGTGWEVLAE